MSNKPPIEVPQGAIRLNTDSQKLEFFAQDRWYEMATETASLFGGRVFFVAGGANKYTQSFNIVTGGTAVDISIAQLYGVHSPAAVNSKTRGVTMGGRNNPSPYAERNVIQFFEFASQGVDMADFGDLTESKGRNSGHGDNTRGISFGRQNGASNIIEFITIPSKGNGTDFGDDVGNSNRATGLSNGTRGIFAGSSEVSPGNVIRYVTIDSLGNAIDFGDLVQGSRSGLGGAASTTRGVFAGGGASDVEYNTIDYVTIASTGNATDFGDLNYSKTSGVGGGSNATRCIWWGGNDTPGYSNVNTICFNTIATTGNSVDFGDTTVTTSGGSACPDATRCVMKLGNSGSGSTGFANIIEFVQFATTGNSTDFGDSVLSTLTTSRGTISSAHGGL